MCSIPGSTRLSVQAVRPVISRASSLRRRALPTSATVGRSSVTVMPATSSAGAPGWAGTGASAIAAAASWMARTMFW